MTPVIGFTTTIVDNFSCYFPTNSRENFTTNLLVFETREISKGVFDGKLAGKPMKKFRLSGIEITGDSRFHGKSIGMATESILQPQRKFQCHRFTYRNRLYQRPVDQLRTSK
jgi:hypothetical protein